VEVSALRRYVIIELTLLFVLTPLFIAFVPRHFGLYLELALVFVAYVLLTFRLTLEIWGVATQPKKQRMQHSAWVMLLFTLPPMLAFLGYAIVKGAALNFASLLTSFPLYLAWALVQQTLFMFYLLGRLRFLFPVINVRILILVNGIAYGLVHLPEIQIALLTIVAGMVWSYNYLHDRVILTIAVSHALLASSFYYWVIGRDLVSELLSNM